MGSPSTSWSLGKILVTGQAGKFRLVPRTVTLGTGAAWLGVITFFCDLLLLYVDGEAYFYWRTKHEEGSCGPAWTLGYTVDDDGWSPDLRSSSAGKGPKGALDVGSDTAAGAWDSLGSLCPAHMDLSVWKTSRGATFSFSRPSMILERQARCARSLLAWARLLGQSGQAWPPPSRPRLYAGPQGGPTRAVAGRAGGSGVADRAARPASAPAHL
nr:uncharacterized protein LOC123288007 isoform X2 [Equus asinus]